MQAFENTFNSLFNPNNEKIKDPKKLNKIWESAKKVFYFSENDTSIRKEVKKYTKKLATVKPGYLLLKKLTKKLFLCNKELSFKYVDKLSKESKFVFRPSKNTLLINPKLKMNYQTFEGSFPFTLCIAFGHELVHALHFLNEFYKNYSSYHISVYQEIDILPTMGNLEEQHATTGFNHHLIDKDFGETLYKDKLEIEDVLSENALHLAFGEPPRIQYQLDESNPKVIEKYSENFETVKQKYFLHLKNQLESIKKIPEKCLQNREQLAEYLKKYPNNIKNLSEKLSNDHELVLLILNDDHSLKFLKEYLPFLCGNSDLAIKLFEKRLFPTNFLEYAPLELSINKDFILKFIKSVIENNQANNNWNYAIKDFIDRPLAKDKDILLAIKDIK